MSKEWIEKRERERIQKQQSVTHYSTHLLITQFQCHLEESANSFSVMKREVPKRLFLESTKSKRFEVSQAGTHLRDFRSDFHDSIDSFEFEDKARREMLHYRGVF